MRIKLVGLSMLVAAAFLGACGAEDQSSDSSSDPFLFGFLHGKCGNGKIDKHEQCDRKNLAGETCASVTLGTRPNGTLSCNLVCRFDTHSCSGKGGGKGGSGGSGGIAGSGGLAGGGSGGLGGGS
jgi:hypothetical protein